MSLLVTCDHCKTAITEVAYMLLAVDAQHVDIHRPITGPTHLHWECVPLYGRPETAVGGVSP